MGKFGGEKPTTGCGRARRATSPCSASTPTQSLAVPQSIPKTTYHIIPSTGFRYHHRATRDGDYAMTIGYPGSTSRYLSSYGIREMRDAENAPRAQVRGVKQDIMTRHMRAGGCTHQIRLEVRPKCQLLEEFHRNEQMYRFHRHHQPEEGIRKPHPHMAGQYGLSERKTRFRYALPSLCKAFRRSACIHVLE